MSTLPPTSVSAAPSIRPMSTRNNYGSNSGIALKVTQATTRVMLKMPTRAPVASLRILFSNFGGSTAINGGSFASEIDGPSTITFKAAVEIAPTATLAAFAPAAANTFIPLFSRGQRTITLEPGADIEMDEVAANLAAGQTLYVRTWYSVPAGGSICGNKLTNATDYEFANNGLFQVALGASTTAAASLTGTLTGTAQQPVVMPLMPSSVGLFGAGITGIVYCDASGNFAAGSGVASGSSVNLSTGAFTVNLSTATAPSAIYAIGSGAYGSAGADETMVAVPSDASYAVQTVWGPSDVFGAIAQHTKTRPFGILGIGDSITWGAGNQQSGEYGQSFLDYSIGGICGMTKIAMSAETLGDFDNINYRRMRMARGRFDRVVMAFGTNDIAIGGTVAALQQSFITATTMLAGMLPNGIADIWACTIIPRVSSATSNTPISAAFVTNRNLFNAWLYTTVGQYCRGVIDFCPAVENNPNSQGGGGDGLWKSLSLTYDGTHPSYAGHQAMAALCGVNGSTPSPAFTFPA